MPLKAAAHVRLHPTFYKHLITKCRSGLKLRSLALLVGFADETGLNHQLRKPFARTLSNETRWRTVASLVNFQGELLQEHQPHE